MAYSIGFNGYETVLRNLMDLRAIVTVEMYADHLTYCNNPSTYFGSFFFYGTGATAGKRFQWIWNLAGEYSAQYGGAFPQPVTIMFGVTDDYAYDSKPNPAAFIDYQYYTWRNSPFAAVVAKENGGPGAYIWERTKINSNGRDDAFRQSFDWYSAAGSTGFRLSGTPIC